MRFFYKTLLIFIFSLIIISNHILFGQICSYNDSASGQQATPPNSSPATGVIHGSYIHATRQLNYTINFSNLTSPTIFAAFNGPAPPTFIGPILFHSPGFPIGVKSGTHSYIDTLTSDQERILLAGEMYLTINTAAYNLGEIRAQIYTDCNCSNTGFPVLAISNGAISRNGAPPSPYAIGCGSNISEDCLSGLWEISFDVTVNHQDPNAVILMSDFLPDTNCYKITYNLSKPLAGFSPLTFRAKISTKCFVSPTCTGSQFSLVARDNCSQSNISECRILFDNVLPVELSAFSSATNENNVALYWTTSSEENNSGFEIERQNSGNGFQDVWKRIGYAEGIGNSAAVNEYSFTDRFLLSGKYKYRLKQIDFNGNFRYFYLGNEVVIGIPLSFDVLQNYPNPFNPVTNISYYLPTQGSIMLKVFDNRGKLIASYNEGSKEAGYYSFEFNASALPSGVYYYRIDFSNGANALQKIMKMALIK